MSDIKWDDFALQSALIYYKNRSVQLEYELYMFVGHTDTIIII